MMLNARKHNNKYQSLKEHSVSVSEMTARRCRDCGIYNLGKLTGLIHDFGKSYQKWQKYLDNNGETVPHSPQSVEFAHRLFYERNEKCAPLTKQILCMAIRGHHSGLHDALSPSGELHEPCDSKYTQQEIDEAEELFFVEVAPKEELQRLFELACEEVEKLYIMALMLANRKLVTESNRTTQANEAMFYMGFVLRYLYSALIDADRLDAAMWEDEEPSLKDASPLWANMLDKLNEKLETFDISGIGVFRAEISDNCGKFDRPNGVYRLFAPTGAGKTFSSLRLALNVAKEHKKEHIIYAIPFLTIIEQNASEIRKAIGENENIDYNKTRQESAVLEYHSNLVFDEDNDDDEAENFYIKRSERWDAPIVMTSTVQFLNALFSRKSSAARRMSAFANSVIIVDEVQAIPTACTYLFDLAINFLANFCNCLVILCTATPPKLENIKYPVRMSEQADIVENIPQVFTAFKRTKIIPFPGKKFSNGELADFVSDKLLETGNCLVILNTKSAAKKLFDSLGGRVPSDCYLFYLSTELCPAHRIEEIRKIKEILGKQKVLVISTQLIEAGVDISFKCVIRALAGLDSIIQAAGRCNRNGEMELGIVYVVNCVDEQLSMLVDIKRGKTISSKMIALYPDSDLASPEMVSQYYEHYFTESKGSLAFSIGNKSAVDLLGNNQTARDEYRQEQNRPYPTDLLAQSFRTVGSEFRPIADDTTGIVVPYGKAKELISKLEQATVKGKKHCYRSLQKYTVNVYENKLRALQSAAVVRFDERIGLWILSDGMYSDKSGIIITSEENIDNYII